jgi:hypothetical protein
LNQIRPLERGDLPAVATLVGHHLLGGRSGPRPDIEAALDGLLASPSSATSDGEVAGFIACHPRRLVLGEERLRAVCCSHLVVDTARAGAAGALLTGRALRGEQDLTITDTATDVVARIWTTYGARVDVTRSLEFKHVLRPLRWARELAPRLRLPGGGRERVRGVPAVPAMPMHLARRFAPRPVAERPPEEGIGGATLEPAALLEALPAVTRRLRLRPDYDEAYLAWVFAALAENRTHPVARVVMRKGRPIGWYVYALHGGEGSRVLQVACLPRDADAVMGDLLADARDRGSALVTGRLEPHLAEALRVRGTAISFGPRHLVHSKRPDVLDALASGEVLVTRLDGEWWGEA